MKTVLITGASSGIGKACTEKFAENGYSIIGVGNNKKRLEKMKIEAISKGAKNCTILCYDFSNQKNIKKLFKEIKNLKKIDAVVNSAGVAYKNTIENLTIGEWEKVIQINLTANFLIIKNSIPFLLKSKNPSIVNISSIAGRNKSLSLGCHYTTTKAAIIGMTRHLATELGPKGIRVNCCAPSQTHTPMLDSALSIKNQKILARTVPLRRLGTAKEQAEVVYFLCSSKSSYINGAIIDVNGGLL